MGILFRRQGFRLQVYFSSDVKGHWEEFKYLAIHRPWELISTRLDNSFAITPRGETPLHIGVAYGEAEFLRSLVRKFEKEENGIEWVTRALGIGNEDGNTPLHTAASFGYQDICDCIASVNLSLLFVRNNAGETPLFSAALRGKTDAFLLLHSRVAGRDNFRNALHYSAYRRTLDGDTILHCAISGEYFDLAYEIIELYQDLAWFVNELGETPLHILASKPSAFRSGSHNLGWKTIIYNCLSVEHLKPKQQSTDSHIPEINDRTGFNFIGLRKKFCRQVVNCFEKHAAADANHDTENPHDERQTAFCTGVSKAIETFFRKFGTIQRIGEEKKKNVWACRIMRKLLSLEKPYEQDSGARPKQKLVSENYYQQYSTVPNPDYDHTDRDVVQVRNERPFFVAARHGITEIVEKVLESDPMATDYVDQDRKNILLLAIENRLTDVLEIVHKKYNLRPSGLMAVDVKGNSALHLAAILPENNPWPVPGATSQMQWEIKWFMFIKHLFSGYSLLRHNKEGKTPEDLFAETHKDLVENSIKWLTNTSQSCSVVAGLFVTIAFTTSTTLPGGARQETGTPYLENQPAFELFAISSQVAFYCSLFSVVVFLAILTSGYQMSDFDKALPRKLLLGLTALYLAIASTLMSFCSAHFFVLKAKLKHAASPLYTATCLVVTLFAIAQFPLYFQLVWATFKKVPQRRSKTLIPQYLFI